MQLVVSIGLLAPSAVKKRYHRSYKLSSCFCFLFFFSILISCSSDDDIPSLKNCMPFSLRTSSWGISDSVVFEYNSVKRLERILLYNNKTLQQTNRVTYDSDNKLIQYTQTYTNSAEPFQTHDVIYDSKGKPAYTNVWESDTSLPPAVITYTHNGTGRLVTKENNKTGYFWHYQYNDHDNVIKTFYKNPLLSGEVLGRENHTFDDRPTFYTNSPELTILFIYILGFEPSKNNVMTSTIRWGDPGYQEPSPRAISHTLLYDDNGLITSDVSQGSTVQGEFFYEDVIYDCQ